MDEVIQNPNSGVIDTGLTLYDLNKQLVEKLPMLTDIVIEKKQKEIRKFINTIHPNVKYYMLLCNELNYYTLFHRDITNKLELQNEMVECLKDLGAIQAIDTLEDKTAIECWIKNETGTYMLLFFPYDMGVIECQ